MWVNFAYGLTLLAHLLAFHLGEWNAVFNPIAILDDRSGYLSMQVVSLGMALLSLGANLPILLSFLKTGSSRTKGGNLDDRPGWQNLRHVPIP
jgi:hypothetical protein